MMKVLGFHSMDGMRPAKQQAENDESYYKRFIMEKMRIQHLRDVW